jgi:enolase-phosphatase E1
VTTPPVAAVVLDIEGTTGSISYVHDVLFPYARRRMAGWVSTHRHTPQWTGLLGDVRAHVGDPDLDEQGALAALAAWSDEDVKAPPLKRLQSYVWAAGFAAGDLTGHVYDDVPPTLAEWHARGIRQYIYSSGAARAQRDWFAHTAHGDLTGLLDGHFDLDTAGGKKDPASYRAISAAVGVPAAATLFFSDVAEELDAARAAGWRTVGVRRPGDVRGPAVAGHHTVARLDPGLIATPG